MKLRTHAILFVVKYLWVPASSAYTPGSDIIRECLECKAALRQATMLSGNTIGARLWTDGKLMAPMLPDHPWLVTCPKCNALIWIDEVNKLAEQHDWDKSRDRPNAITPGIPTEMDYLELLDGLLPRTKELYLRRQAWWTANDAVRTDESAQVVWSTA